MHRLLAVPGPVVTGACAPAIEVDCPASVSRRLEFPVVPQACLSTPHVNEKASTLKAPPLCQPVVDGGRWWQ